MGCDPARYARSLLEILELKRTLQMVPAFPGMKPVDVTSQRLERIMQLRQGCRQRTPWWCWMILMLSAAATLPGAALLVADDEPAAPAPPAVDTLHAVAGQRRANEIVREYQVADVVAKIHEQRGDDEPTTLRWLVKSLKMMRPVLFTVPFGTDQSPDTPDPVVAIASEEACRIVVTASEETHRFIATQLDGLRQLGIGDLRIEIHFITAAPQLIKTAVSEWQIQTTKQSGEELAGDRIGVPLNRPSPEDGAQEGTRATVTTESRLPVLLKIVDDRQAARILRTLEADSRTKVLAAPTIRVFSGQSATVQDASLTAFVVGVKDGTPQRRFITEGIRMGLRPLLLRGDKVWLDLELRGSEITKVSKTAVKVAGREEELTLEIPEVRETRIESAVEIPLGQTLVLNGPEFRHADKKPQPMLVSVRVDRIPTETPAEQTKPQRQVGIGSDSDAGVIGTVVVDKMPTDPSAATPTSERKPERAETNLDDHFVRVYNVADLLGADGNSAAVAGEEGSQDAAGKTAALDALVRRITVEVLPDTWDGSGGSGTVEAFPTNLSLVVSHAAKAHLAVHNYLNNLREQRGLSPCPDKPPAHCPPRDDGVIQTRTYAVADLVIPVPNFASSTAPQRVKADFKPLIDLITSTVEPSSWSCVRGRGTITTVPTNLSLIIEQTASVHQEISELLGQMRRLQDIQVTVETKFLGLPQRMFERIGRDFPGAGGPAEDGGEFSREGWSRLSETEATRLLGACQADDLAEILQSPKLTLFNGQVGRVAWQDHGAKVTLQYQGILAADGKSVQLTVMLGEAQPGASPRAAFCADSGRRGAVAGRYE